MVRINPSTITVETNQLIQFRAHGRTETGDSVAGSITWQTTGGTILPDGRFTAASVGTYTVIATNHVRGTELRDSSLVQVVRRQAKLASVEITPASAALTPGVSQAFSAIGRLQNGKQVEIGVVWSANGGSIDPAGNYVAGDTAGTYQVVATNTAGTLSDTATVTITAPAAPPPPTPVLAQVVLKPASVTLAPATKKQFAWFGRMSVTFTATGGTITSGGLYTAGNTAGTFRVVAKTGSLADTSSVTITPPLGSGSPTGLPFGPSQQLARTGGIQTPFNMTSDGGYTPDNMVSRINAARQGGYKLLLAIPSGSHRDATSPLLSVINGVLQFDESKWRAQVDRFNTPTIKQAIADAVRDGIIIGDVIMDEPQVTGSGDGNTWGPAGTMTKLRLDGMCTYVKNIFPTLPIGVFHQHNTFEPDKSYKVCDFIVDQYNHRRGDIYTFRDDGLALAKRDGHAIMFSLNILNGGVQDKDGVWDCSGTGGLGTYAPNCRMTADQVREWGKILGPVGCGLYLWRYDDTFVKDPANQQAFKDLAAVMGSAAARSCRR
jgi:hypothetical protein